MDVKADVAKEDTQMGMGPKQLIPLETETKQGKKRDTLAGSHRHGQAPHPDCVNEAWSRPAFWNWPVPTAVLAVLAGQNKGCHTLDHCPNAYGQYNSNEVLVPKVR